MQRTKQPRMSSKNKFAALTSKYNSYIKQSSSIIVFNSNNMATSGINNLKENTKPYGFFFKTRKRLMLKIVKDFNGEDVKIDLGIHSYLFFVKSKTDTEKILNFFKEYKYFWYLSEGETCPMDFSIEEGLLNNGVNYISKSHSKIFEPYGIVIKENGLYCEKQVEVCKSGAILTEKTARILKLFEKKPKEYTIDVLAVVNKKE